MHSHEDSKTPVWEKGQRSCTILCACRWIHSMGLLKGQLCSLSLHWVSHSRGKPRTRNVPLLLLGTARFATLCFFHRPLTLSVSVFNSTYVPLPNDTLCILKSFSKEENCSVATSWEPQCVSYRCWCFFQAIGKLLSKPGDECNWVYFLIALFINVFVCFFLFVYY